MPKDEATDKAIKDNAERLRKAIAASNMPIPVAAILAAILRAATEAATELVPWLAIAMLRQALQLRPEDDR